jgi:LmbE family N-acetylglucosaminyl deacetylase
MKQILNSLIMPTFSILERRNSSQFFCALMIKHCLRKQLFFLFFVGAFYTTTAQTPKTYTSSEILLQLKKLNVLGSVLYIAAHPDDENTRLLAYLANEKLYRTGYLSLTRGDGGQNLIGDEQGVDLGLIRTQELLAARRVDGAEQFFSRAFDFGFSKSPEEALRIWGHDKILSDVVWVIRNFKPDVVIARFPTTGEGGHGHHTASAMLAGEAFDAAADSTKFPEQLKNGVTIWQAKRLLWNTFNFGSTNTQSESQFKIDVGMYNPLLGKSYGEIAALSRSQHKSQGFGVPAQRGSVVEYFKTLKGDAPVKDLMDGVNTSWDRAGDKLSAQQSKIKNDIDSLVNYFKNENPENNITKLAALHKSIFFLMFDTAKLRKEMNDLKLGKEKKEFGIKKEDFFILNKSKEIDELILTSSGLFLEATAATQLNTIGDSIRINITINNRLNIPVKRVIVNAFNKYITFTDLPANKNTTQVITTLIDKTTDATQPYWLKKLKEKGAYIVEDQGLIGNPESNSNEANFQVYIGKEVYNFFKPIMYKYTDPVKGELYQPIQVVNPVFINAKPSLLIFSNSQKNQKKSIHYTIQSNLAFHSKAVFKSISDSRSAVVFDSTISFLKNEKVKIDFGINGDSLKDNSSQYFGGELTADSLYDRQYYSLRKIGYDHIPDIYYNYYDAAKVIKMDLKTSGSLAGYIPGAGDKIPDALEQMGYKVVTLKETDITPANLKQFDVIITGVRAYNTNDWMNNVYSTLMQYVKDGGVLFTQYNTNNFISNVKSKIGPFDFTISRNRITDEEAKVNFLLPNHPALNYPNKITEKDFEGWIQERSIYHAEKIDSNYKRILSMKDPGENENDGSLIIAAYGKGKFVYSGLVFFRELPAGVPGAYRLFANLISKPNMNAEKLKTKSTKPLLAKPKAAGSKRID